MKTTHVKYCGECLRDFKANEVVWFAPIENDCFCSKCKAELDIKDWEKRLFTGEGK